MRALASALAFSLFLSFFTLGVVQQPSAAKGRMEGLVLKGGTTEPVVGARVTLARINTATGQAIGGGSITGTSSSSNGAQMPMPLGATNPLAPVVGRGGIPAIPPPPPQPLLPAIPAVTTDRQGKFVIPDLDAGSYRATITSNGYVKQEYGQRVFPGQGMVLTLTAGQVLKDLTVRMMQTGNVSGRIRDNFGQPAVGIPVQLLKTSFNVSGQRIFQAAGATRTNDRGEYRLYWVTPGRYFVAAGTTAGFSPGGPLSPGGPAVTSNETVETYSFSFYPGVSDLGMASAVEVTSGSELGIDFLAPIQETFKIKGRVVSENSSQPPTSITASLAFMSLGGGGGTWTFNTPYDPTSGAFELRDVLPGSYALQIAAPGAVARVPVDVRSNLDGLTIVVSSGFSIPGRVTIEGQAGQLGMDRVRPQLRFVNGPIASAHAGGVSPLSVLASTDGTFRFDNVLPGEYRAGFTLTGAAPLPEFYVKEASLDRNDVLNQPLQVSSAMASGATFNIVLSPNVGQIDGVVTDDKQQPVPGVQAVIIPERGRDRADLYKTATTDQNGRFTIRAVAPGDYKVFAWETLENFGYFDPEVLKKSEQLGAAVHVGESSKVSADVKIIPAGR